MKPFLNILAAGIIGSAITIGAVEVFDINAKQVKISYADAPAIRFASNAKYNNAVNVMDFTEPAKKSMPSVVNIQAKQRPGSGGDQSFRYYNIPDPFRDFFGDDFEDMFRDAPRGQAPEATGSGVIISSEGYIITNNHVIENADEIEVTLYDKRSYKATLVGSDPSTDLAVIQIQEKDLSAITLANSDQVRVGEWVLAVGNPFNLSSTVTAGIVSAKGRSIQILKDKSAVESFIQTDAAVNPGNSGGALVNMEGHLIGINTAIASPTGSYAGYAFSVPSNIVKKVVEDILKYGIVQRGYLGVIIRGLDSKLANELGLDVRSGVLVDSLTENSSAAAAGIKRGDVITHIDSVPVNSAPELQEVVARYRPGDAIKIIVLREGKSKLFTVTLRNREGKTDIVKKEKATVFGTLGIELENISNDQARRLKIDGGVVVKELLPGRIRKQTAMEEGFVITKVDGVKVKNVEEFKKVIESKKGGVMIEGIYPDSGDVQYYAFGL